MHLHVALVRDTFALDVEGWGPRVGAMALADIDLRQLADLEAPERAFVSYYFSGPDRLSLFEQRRARAREVLERTPRKSQRIEEAQATELEHFERSTAMIEEWLEANPPTSAGCVFACWALDMLEAHASDLPLPDYLYVGSAPYLRPLANLVDEYETFVLVMAEHDGCTIHLVTFGEAEQQGRVKGDIKNHVKKGGWSQKRYQRRRANQIRDFASEVGERLAALAQDEDFDRIVFVGSTEAIDAIIAELPQPVLDKSIRKKGIDLHEGEEHALAEAFELFVEQEREAEAELWASIQEETMRGGLAAVGATAVLEAALAGRVEVIAVTRGIEKKGTRCRDCEALVHGTPETCQSCGSASVFTVDLVDELTRLAEATSARVDFVEPIEDLEVKGDVAALLRW